MLNLGQLDLRPRDGAAGPLQPGMRRYRFPTSILWVDDGYRIFQARDAGDALAVYRRDWPLSAGHVTLPNRQIEVDGKWKFAANVPPALGGYAAGS